MTPENDNNPARLGVVSYLNSRPLIEGLQDESAVRLEFAVPSALPAMLQQGRVDAALIPIIDLAGKADTWERISDAGIGSDGETLTVRVFSRIPPEQITTLHTDNHSHTSVALARLIWKHCYNQDLSVVPTDVNHKLEDDCRAVLLIGDKVVTAPLHDFEYDVDLGTAWKKWTNLPFVFAVWAASVGRDNRQLAELLIRARDRGVANATDIATRMAPDHGWPVDLAREYLTERLAYTITPQAQKGMELFLELTGEQGLIPKPPELVT